MPIVAHADPGLVDIQDDLVQQVHLEEGHGELLPQNQVSRRIGCYGNGVYLAITHLEVFLHDIMD